MKPTYRYTKDRVAYKGHSIVLVECNMGTAHIVDGDRANAWYLIEDATNAIDGRPTRNEAMDVREWFREFGDEAFSVGDIVVEVATEGKGPGDLVIASVARPGGRETLYRVAWNKDEPIQLVALRAVSHYKAGCASNVGILDEDGTPRWCMTAEQIQEVCSGLEAVAADLTRAEYKEHWPALREVLLLLHERIRCS